MLNLANKPQIANKRTLLSSHQVIKLSSYQVLIWLIPKVCRLDAWSRHRQTSGLSGNKYLGAMMSQNLVDRFNLVFKAGLINRFGRIPAAEKFTIEFNFVILPSLPSTVKLRDSGLLGSRYQTPCA